MILLGVAVGNQQTLHWHDLDQLAKRFPKRVGVGIEVDMVVLHPGQNQCLGTIVQKLGSTIEVGGVVLVAFDDETWARSAGEARLEVEGEPADEIPGILVAGRIDRSRESRSGGLSVGSADDDGLTTLEEEAAQGFGHRNALDSEPLGLLRLGVVARHRVADDHEIGRRLQMRRVESDQRLDSVIGEKSAHRRVQWPVGAPHLVAFLAEQAGQGSDSRPADRNQMDRLDVF